MKAIIVVSGTNGNCLFLIFVLCWDTNPQIALTETSVGGVVLRGILLKIALIPEIVVLVLLVKVTLCLLHRVLVVTPTLIVHRSMPMWVKVVIVEMK